MYIFVLIFSARGCVHCHLLSPWKRCSWTLSLRSVRLLQPCHTLAARDKNEWRWFGVAPYILSSTVRWKALTLCKVTQYGWGHIWSEASPKHSWRLKKKTRGRGSIIYRLPRCDLLMKAGKPKGHATASRRLVGWLWPSVTPSRFALSYETLEKKGRERIHSLFGPDPDMHCVVFVVPLVEMSLGVRTPSNPELFRYSSEWAL